MPYLTPESLPADTVVRQLSIPQDLAFLGAVTGALLELTFPENWEQHGAVTPEEAAAAMNDMLHDYLDVNP